MREEPSKSPSPAAISGIGAVTHLGRDLDQIVSRLAAGPEPMERVFRVDEELLNDPQLAKSLRRADRFVRMAAIAALDAWRNAGTPEGLPAEQIGLIVTSGFGPHCRGFRFLDGILDAGDGEALPTDFSHSVHGAAASYIAGLLDLRGPSLTTTDFEIGFEQAVLLAQCWLDQGTCRRVLVGAVEELGPVMERIALRMLGPRRGIALGEGAVFLALGPQDSCALAAIDAAAVPDHVDVLLREDVPLVPDSGPCLIRAAQTLDFTSRFGRTTTTAAFQLLGGLLSTGSRSKIDSETSSCHRAIKPITIATHRITDGQPSTLTATVKAGSFPRPTPSI